MVKYKEVFHKEEYTNLSHEETLKVLKENHRENKELRFNSSKENINSDLDTPNSLGDLEEELFGP